jgi:FXSXX-COOH protein
MQQTGSLPSDDDAESAIVDLRRLPLDAVLQRGDTVLDNAVSRQLDSMGKPGENYAAHGSTPAL